MIDEVVVDEETYRHPSADDARNARRSPPVLEKPLVDGDAKDSHLLFSSEKIFSVGHLNTRAKVRASGRLGTYRSRSIELMLWRETPTASASSCCVHPCSSRSSLTRFNTTGGMTS